MDAYCFHIFWKQGPVFKLCENCNTYFQSTLSFFEQPLFDKGNKLPTFLMEKTLHDHLLVANKKAPTPTLGSLQSSLQNSLQNSSHVPLGSHIHIVPTHAMWLGPGPGPDPGVGVWGTWGGGMGVMGMWEFGGTCELFCKLHCKLPRVGVGTCLFSPQVTTYRAVIFIVDVWGPILTAYR